MSKEPLLSGLKSVYNFFVTFTDFEDEILDLLSDGEDMAPKTRTKPKIQLIVKKPKPQEPSKADDKPITSPTEGHASSGIELERPGTSRGLPQSNQEPGTTKTVAMATPTLVPVKEGNADVLKVETSNKKTNDSKSIVTFDDDDDILGGLGFDDEKPPSRHKATTPTSRLDDLLGVNKSSSMQSKQSKTKSSSKADETGTAISEADDGGFQFGGYIPSSVGDVSGPSRRGSLKLPSGRRRGSSELDSRVTDKPNTSSPVRKSVHFAENLETSEKPASSSVKSRRSSLKGEKTTPPSLDKQSVKSVLPGEDSNGRQLSRKPPLPVKADQVVGSSDDGDKAMLNDRYDCVGLKVLAEENAWVCVVVLFLSHS